MSCVAAKVRRPNVTAVRFKSLWAQPEIGLTVMVKTVGCLACSIIRVVAVDTVPSACSVTMTRKPGSGAASALVT